MRCTVRGKKKSVARFSLRTTARSFLRQASNSTAYSKYGVCIFSCGPTSAGKSILFQRCGPRPNLLEPRPPRTSVSLPERYLDSWHFAARQMLGTCTPTWETWARTVAMHTIVLRQGVSTARDLFTKPVAIHFNPRRFSADFPIRYRLFHCKNSPSFRNVINVEHSITNSEREHSTKFQTRRIVRKVPEVNACHLQSLDFPGRFLNGTNKQFGETKTVSSVTYVYTFI